MSPTMRRTKEGVKSSLSSAALQLSQRVGEGVRAAVADVSEPVIGSGRAAGKPLSRRRLATRNKLIAAARDQFARAGVNGTSVEKIAEAAGFTRGAFYSNFDDINDIAAAVCTIEFRRFESSLQETWRRLHDSGQVAGPHAVNTIVAALVDALPLDQPTYLVQTELLNQLIRNPDQAQRLAEPIATFTANLGQFLAEAVASLGLELTVEPQRLAGIMMALFRHGSERILIAQAQGGAVAEADTGALSLLGGERPVSQTAQALQVLPHLIRAFTRPAKGAGAD